MFSPVRKNPHPVCGFFVREEANAHIKPSSVKGVVTRIAATAAPSAVERGDDEPAPAGVAATRTTAPAPRSAQAAKAKRGQKRGARIARAPATAAYPAVGTDVLRYARFGHFCHRRVASGERGRPARLVDFGNIRQGFHISLRSRRTRRWCFRLRRGL